MLSFKGFVCCVLGCLALGCQTRCRTLTIKDREYQAPAHSESLSEADSQRYLEGYRKGWDRIAERWECRIYSDGTYRVKGDDIFCRAGDDWFQRGFEDGQLKALQLAEQTEIELLK